jgi:flagellar FliL protein
MTGKKMIDMILLGLNTFATLAALGVMVYTVILFERPTPNPDAEKKELLSGGRTYKPISSFKMKRIIINIPSTTARLRFLEIKAVLVPFKDDQMAEIEKNKHIVRDTFLDIAGEMTPEELNSITGKIILEDRIKKRLNKSLGARTVQEMYFQKYVVQ